MSKYITCDQLITDFLLDYVASALPSDKAFEFERHLAVCPPCERYLKNYRETIALAKASGSTPRTLDRVPDDLVRAILKARHSGG